MIFGVGVLAAAGGVIEAAAHNQAPFANAVGSAVFAALLVDAEAQARERVDAASLCRLDRCISLFHANRRRQAHRTSSARDSSAMHERPHQDEDGEQSDDDACRNGSIHIWQRNG